MTNIYAEIDWAAQRTALDAVDRLLTSMVGRAPEPAQEAFEQRFAQIQRFNVDQTGFSPLMLYFLYQLGAQSQARRVLGLGVYAGIAISMLAAGAKDGGGNLVSAIGVDGDAEYVALSERNSAVMKMDNRLTYQCADPLEFMEAYNLDVDLLMIDVHHPVREKDDYGPIMRAATGKMPHGAVVIAHDALIKRWKHNVQDFEAVLAAAGDFNGPWTLPIDDTGIVLAIRQ